MKLSELRFLAHVGTHPGVGSTTSEGKPFRYFPHVHLDDENTCDAPQYFKDGGRLVRAMGNAMTINTAPRNVDQPIETFDAIAELIAAAPALLDALATALRGEMSDEQRAAASALVDSLLRHDLVEVERVASYFNADGTPWTGVL